VIRKVALLVGFCVCLSTPAMSADGPYLGVNVGITMPSDSDISDPSGNGRISFDSGVALSATIGQKIGIGRLEAELGYKKADLKKVFVDGLGSAAVNGDISVLSLMGNGYIDFGANPSIKPYIMAGIGGAKLKLKSSDMDADEEDNVFAYQAGVGCGIAISKDVTFDVSYRYMGTSDANFNGTEVTYGSHNLLGGLRFSF
jgi:opacity protein-like surface antigen